MKAAIYARVSTRDKGQDPELQLRPMREYCQRMKYEFDEYVDFASGIKESRPELDKLMSKLNLREYDMLMVWKLDRLARSMKQLIDIVHGELKPRNIDFKCLTQDFDTSTSTGKLLFNVLGALGEFEHDLHSERITEGMANAKLKGKRIGRKRADVDVEKLCTLYQHHKGVRPAVREYNKGLPEGGKKLNPGTAYGVLSYLGVLKKKEGNDVRNLSV